MKLYTKTGDDGTTSLFGGQRVSKDALRVETYGSVDELNAHMGLCTVACGDLRLREMLQRLQSRLFDLGADLATPLESGGPAVQAKVPRFSEQDAAALEPWIDELNSQVQEMKYFILPGGTELAARLHVARTVCRRAERLCITLGRREAVSPGAAIFLNRLSDLLFVMSRRANALDGVADIPWKSDAEP